MIDVIKKYKYKEISKENLLESFQGWNAYAKWADSYKLRRNIVKMIYLQINKEIMRKIIEGESVLKLGKIVETRVKEG
jgi:hypothetical protein